MAVSGRSDATGEIGVIGASSTGLQCVLYLAKLKVPCRAIARDPKVAEAAVNRALPAALRKNVSYYKADVTLPKTLPSAVRGCRAVIFAATATAGWRLPFYDNSETPPHVDFEGSVNAASAAVAEGVSRFILVSSLAVTQPSHAMHIARNTAMGRIMDWKLLGEQGVQKVYDAVQKSSTRDMAVTIVRPGFLTDEAAAGPGGLLVDTGDNLAGSVSRADLAAVCAEAALRDDAKRLVFEVVAGQQGGNYPVCANWEHVFSSLKNGHLPVASTSCLQAGAGGLGIQGLCGVQDVRSCT
eukprot:CAMPEP_0177691706 /NCGR_PEP_ID=MMETSP0484_2-20121128/1455_1 /TAXON_ID=354590 /ORGANISM="Rhodomonas lens, Strain RHODO" /LENGTH=296 /DNA_ID=CAMNT_0019202359 /DNA_START=324 /DNA_END=1214 /DNA_ORIENTATION=+